MTIGLSILLVVLGIYILISLLLYFLQDYFLFKPEKLPKEFQYEYENQVVDEYPAPARLAERIVWDVGIQLPQSIGAKHFIKGKSGQVKRSRLKY